MTEREIAELTATCKHGLSTLIDPVAKADAILRVLDERRVLLKALEDTRPRLSEHDAAIAYALAPVHPKQEPWKQPSKFVLCMRCAGTGTESYFQHGPLYDVAYQEPIRCSECDGFGRVPAPSLTIPDGASVEQKSNDSGLDPLFRGK